MLDTTFTQFVKPLPRRFLMSTTSKTKTAIAKELDLHLLPRIIKEGYGSAAWHGPNLKAAIEDVSPELVFRRPSPDRHNIAEIALHHAYCARSVRGQLSGLPLESFVLEGDDWFSLSDHTSLSWPQIRDVLDSEQQRLATVVDDIVAGRSKPALTASECQDLVIGITCHAVYHAGQVQLIKKLLEVIS